MKTLRELHQAVKKEAKAIPEAKIAAVLAAINGKGVQSFYDLIAGRKELSPPEKEAIAKIYNAPVNEIDWKERKSAIA